MKGILAVAQSGGPTAVMNASLVGVLTEAQRHTCFNGIYGLMHGLEGALNEELLDLSSEKAATLQRLIKTPAAVLGGSRNMVRDEEYERMIHVFRAHEIRYFVQMGGNGSMFVCHRLLQVAQHMGYELHIIGVPKTIDNDLQGTDHSPGYGSAARFLALATRDVGRDLESMTTYEDVILLETMGRDAGWLPGASALLKEHDDDAPHLVYMPEIAFDRARFLDDIRRVHSRLGHVFVVVGEGIRDASGNFIGTGSTPSDRMGRPVYSLSTGVAHALAVLVNERLGLQVRVLRPGLIGRNLTTCVSPVDRQGAYRVGIEAVRYLAEGMSGYMVTLPHPSARSDSGKNIVPLEDVGGQTKRLPREFINVEGTMLTHPFYEYAMPLIGTLPPTLARLRGTRVAKRLNHHE